MGSVSLNRFNIRQFKYGEKQRCIKRLTNPFPIKYEKGNVYLRKEIVDTVQRQTLGRKETFLPCRPGRVGRT